MSILVTFFLETLLRPPNAHTAAHRVIFESRSFSELDRLFYFEWRADCGAASLPRYRLAGHFASSGAKLISKRDPVASAKRSSVRIDGRERPLSRRATTGCVVPILRASSSCVRPARLRTSMTAPFYCFTTFSPSSISRVQRFVVQVPAQEDGLDRFFQFGDCLVSRCCMFLPGEAAGPFPGAVLWRTCLSGHTAAALIPNRRA
jgi:hypothetical protein